MLFHCSKLATKLIFVLIGHSTIYMDIEVELVVLCIPFQNFCALSIGLEEYVEFSMQYNGSMYMNLFVAIMCNVNLNL